MGSGEFDPVARLKFISVLGLGLKRLSAQLLDQVGIALPVRLARRQFEACALTRDKSNEARFKRWCKLSTAKLQCRGLIVKGIDYRAVDCGFGQERDSIVQREIGIRQNDRRRVHEREAALKLVPF